MKGVITLQLTVPLLAIIIFIGSTLAYVGLVVAGHIAEAEPFKLAMGAAIGAGIGVAIPKPTPSP